MFTQKTINFMSVQKIAIGLSIVLLLISAISLFTKGLNLGLDFTGGSLVEVVYPESIEPEAVRQHLNQAGYDDVTVQHFGTSKNIMIRLAPQEGVDKNKVGDNILDVLKAENPQVLKVQSGFVGPQIGEELREDGGLAMLYALIGILIYIALRFELRFSGGAIFALVHDVVLTLGFFSITQVEFDMTVLAAILAIIGYSLNDTIVVFDRIRENFRIFLKKSPEHVVNISINHTLTRTLITSLTTLLVLIILFFFGGKIIHAFALAMIVGIIVGTYSSIYIASSSLLMMGITKEALLPPEKENEELDQSP